jgi:hypothetical protein
MKKPTRADWEDFARSLGISDDDIDGLTTRELRDLVIERGAQKPKKRKPRPTPPRKVVPPEERQPPRFRDLAFGDIALIRSIVSAPRNAVFAHDGVKTADVLIIYPLPADRAAGESMIIADVDALSKVSLRLTWWIRIGFSLLTTDDPDDPDRYHRKGNLWQKDVYVNSRLLREPGMALEAFRGPGGLLDRSGTMATHWLIDLGAVEGGGKPDREEDPFGG